MQTSTSNVTLIGSHPPDARPTGCVKQPLKRSVKIYSQQQQCLWKESRSTVCKADGMFDGKRNTVQQSVARRWIQDDNRDIRLLDSAVTVSITHSAVRIATSGQSFVRRATENAPDAQQTKSPASVNRAHVTLDDQTAARDQARISKIPVRNQSSTYEIRARQKFHVELGNTQAAHHFSRA